MFYLHYRSAFSLSETTIAKTIYVILAAIYRDRVFSRSPSWDGCGRWL